ncbi:MAG: magnesium/cobalt transporter CorA [Candidatus Omnitrophica bacterium]|nr:magnesium/cobalt transporter CorA [Candidatus Omnitrophota bacterium]
MSKLNKRKYKQLSIKTEAPQRQEPVRITVIDYNETSFEQKEVNSVEECFAFKDKPTITWINVDGIHKTEILEKLANCFELHPLILEDISDTDQRPKVEDLDTYVYIVLKMMSYGYEESEIQLEQISIIFGNNFVISFQQTIGDVFDRIRERLKNGKGRIRKMGADYLAYALVDAIVDNYFDILDQFGERIEFLEEETISGPDTAILKEIYHLKREMIFLRQSIWPLRDLLRGLERSESHLIKDVTRIYFRDIQDHVIHIIDSMDIFREMLTGLVEIYLSSLSNRLNEVMKVLTVIATIFMPLTFITGIFGMNFIHIPGLAEHWGFPAALAIMLAVGIYMLFYFRKRSWL